MASLADPRGQTLAAKKPRFSAECKKLVKAGLAAKIERVPGSSLVWLSLGVSCKKWFLGSESQEEQKGKASYSIRGREEEQRDAQKRFIVGRGI